MLNIERVTPKKPWMMEYNFVLVQNMNHLKEIVDQAIEAKQCAFDLESTGLDTRIFNNVCKSSVVGYSLCFDFKTGYYIPIRHEVETDKGKNLRPEEVNAQIKRLLDNCEIIGHNWLKFDAEMMLASEGLDLRKDFTGTHYPFHDTFVLARIAGKQPAGLKYLSKTLLSKEMIELDEVVDSKGTKTFNFAAVSPFEGCVYAASDAICTLELFQHPDIQAPIKDQGIIYNLERKVIRVVRKMERNKVKLDEEHTQKMDEDLLSRIAAEEIKIFNFVKEFTKGQITEFKLDSPDDVSRILFEVFDMNPKPEKGKKGNYKTDDDTLMTLSKYPLAKMLQEYRMLTKFHRTYIRNMVLNVDEEGYLKFNFAPLRTDSGRFATPGRETAGVGNDGYAGINIQATPSRYDETKPNVRKSISCEDDEVIAALDWSGVELRVATNMSQEPIWLNRFLAGDGDLHTSTAAIIFDKPENEITKLERNTGKCVHEKSLVYVNDKYIRIGSIHPAREIDTFYNLSEKLEITTDHNNSVANIKQFYSNGPTETLLVCHRRGVLVCSPNHKLELEDGTLVAAKNIKSSMILKEVPPNIISRDVVTEIPINPFLKTKIASSSFVAKVTPALAYFCGLFIGDGSCSKNGVSIAAGSYGKYLTWQDEIQKSLEEIGLTCKDRVINDFRIPNKIPARNIYFGSRHTSSVLAQMSLVDDTSKKILEVPNYILNNTLEIKLNFLAGLLDTDGTVSRDGSSDMTTKSWVLAQDMCVLLASCGLHYSLEPTFNKTYQRYYFRIRIAKRENPKIRKYIKCFWKKERLVDPKFEYRKYPKNVITKVIPLKEEHLVDIGVDTSEHMYMVNNVRTHNTFNFQTVYGGGPGALASTLGITFDDAKNKQQKYFGALKTLKHFITKTQKTAEAKGYCETQFGRKRMLPNIKSDDPRTKAGEYRKAINSPIQGSAADLMKFAMLFIDKYIEDNNLNDTIQMLITMHDELVFRVKKNRVDLIAEIAEIMKLDGLIKKIKWPVQLGVDVEIGSSWDVDYEYFDMLKFLKAKKNIDTVGYIYQKGVDYRQIIKEYKAYLAEKKANKAKPVEAVISKDGDLKKDAEVMRVKNEEAELEKEAKVTLEELVLEHIESDNKTLEMAKSVTFENTHKEEGSLEEMSATATEVVEAFKILGKVSLSDLPEEAYSKLKKSFYENEFERLMSGKPSTDDAGVEIPIIVHDPIDDAKMRTIGYIIDSCKGGRGSVKFVSQNKEILHEDWLDLDILKVAVMCKIFNV